MFQAPIYILMKAFALKYDLFSCTKVQGQITEAKYGHVHSIFCFFFST